jgi:Ca2+-binding RTX toxin-like protein
LALHEIGHAIGLKHEDDVPAIMNTYQQSFGYVINGLQLDDIAGVQSLYGVPVAPVSSGPTELDDLLHGSDSGEMIAALAGNDVVHGNGGNDVMWGNGGFDLLNGGAGADLIYGNQQNDTILGGQDQDTIYGNLGDDIGNGNLGDDVLFGGQDQDTLYGGQGSDQLFGNIGDDQLIGNLGNDWLIGGDGADIFVFGPASGNDVVADFVSGLDTVLLASNVNSSGLKTPSDALAQLDNSDAGAVLHVGGGHTVTFTGLDVSQFDESDFSFF